MNKKCFCPLKLPSTVQFLVIQIFKTDAFQVMDFVIAKMILTFPMSENVYTICKILHIFQSKMINEKKNSFGEWAARPIKFWLIGDWCLYATLGFFNLSCKVIVFTTSYLRSVNRTGKQKKKLVPSKFVKSV